MYFTKQMLVVQVLLSTVHVHAAHSWYNDRGGDGSDELGELGESDEEGTMHATNSPTSPFDPEEVFHNILDGDLANDAEISESLSRPLTTPQPVDVSSDGDRGSGSPPSSNHESRRIGSVHSGDSSVDTEAVFAQNPGIVRLHSSFRVSRTIAHFTSTMHFQDSNH